MEWLTLTSGLWRECDPTAHKAWLPIIHNYTQVIIVASSAVPSIRTVLHTCKTNPHLQLVPGLHTQCRPTQSTVLYVWPVHLYTAALPFMSHSQWLYRAVPHRICYWNVMKISMQTMSRSKNCWKASIDCRWAWNLTYAPALPRLTLHRLPAMKVCYSVTDTLAVNILYIYVHTYMCNCETCNWN